MRDVRLKHPLRFIDMFAGIGGMRSGLEQAGMTCVGHIEWDKFAQQSYKAIYSHGREEAYEREFCGWDITGVKASDLPRADIWTFGAPCQDFSMAGKRTGLDGDRSSLIREVFRLVRETEERNRPTWLVYENVKGMLSTNGGGGILQQSSLKWNHLGTIWSGRCSTQSITADHKIGSGSTLSDILEAEVEDKYFLSEEQVSKLVWK